MGALTDARAVLADAVTGTGLVCTAYTPDSTVAPSAWIDSITVDYEASASMCLTGQAEALIIAVGQRNDRAGSSQMLEEIAPDVIAALEGIDGVRVTRVESGTAEVNGQTLPAVLTTCTFFITS